MCFAWKFSGSTLEHGMPLPSFYDVVQCRPPVHIGGAGLHAHIDAYDALQVARGPLLHFVRASGQMVIAHGQVASTEQQFLNRLDTTLLLDEFARWCALQVASLWDAPPVVWAFLEGDSQQRDAARVASFQALADQPPIIKTAIRMAIQLAAPDEARVEPWLAAQSTLWNQQWVAADGLDVLAWAEARDAAEARQRERFNELIGRALSA